MSIDIDYDDGTLTVTRVLDAPRALVFDAWTNPEVLTQWYGCAMTERVEASIDLRLGGAVSITLHGGYGTMAQEGVITDLVVPERFAFESEPAMPGMPPQRIDVTFEETDGGTRVTLRHSGLIDDPQLRQYVTGGWSAAFGKLADAVDE